jgi:hypothetical protein
MAKPNKIIQKYLAYICLLIKKPLFLQSDFEKSISKGVYQSGQMGQTVNLLVYAYGGSNPSAPTL